VGVVVLEVGFDEVVVASSEVDGWWSGGLASHVVKLSIAVVIRTQVSTYHYLLQVRLQAAISYIWQVYSWEQRFRHELENVVTSDVGSEVPFHVEYLSEAIVEVGNVEVIQGFGGIESDCVGTWPDGSNVGVDVVTSNIVGFEDDSTVAEIGIEGIGVGIHIVRLHLANDFVVGLGLDITFLASSSDHYLVSIFTEAGTLDGDCLA